MRRMSADPLHSSRRVAIARMRRCLRCAKPLARRARSDAKYCSTGCQIAHWRRRRRTVRALTRKLKCESCGKRLAITRRADALYCSTRCRQRIYRQRQATAVAAMPRKSFQRVKPVPTVFKSFLISPETEVRARGKVPHPGVEAGISGCRHSD